MAYLRPYRCVPISKIPNERVRAHTASRSRGESYLLPDRWALRRPRRNRVQASSDTELVRKRVARDNLREIRLHIDTTSRDCILHKAKPRTRSILSHSPGKIRRLRDIC